MIIKKKSFFILRLLSDYVFICTAFLVAAIFAQSWQILLTRNYMFILLLLQIIIWYFSSSSFGLYEDFTAKNFLSQFIIITKNFFIQAFVSIIFIFLVKEDLFTRNFILYYSILGIIVISIRIIIYKNGLKYFKEKSRSISNLLIISSGKLAEQIKETILENLEFGHNLVDILDYEDQQYLNPDTFRGIIKEKKINEVIIAPPSGMMFSDSKLESLIRVCNKEAVRVHLIPDYFNFLSNKFRIGLLGNFPVITLRDEPLEELHWRFLKRCFDLIVSLLVILCLLSWVLPILFVLQKIFSKGEMFFVQDRIGKNNAIFKCYKLRTMAETYSDVLPSGERHVTKFGAFLRKSNLDELPQFYNVFLGTMSLVGPRPHAIHYNEVYKEYIEYIKLRNLVKPGITGWAQVHGLRGDVDNEEENKKLMRRRIEFDVWYIENWSFWLDVQIILLTIWQTLFGINRGT